MISKRAKNQSYEHYSKIRLKDLLGIVEFTSTVKFKPCLLRRMLRFISILMAIGAVSSGLTSQLVMASDLYVDQRNQQCDDTGTGSLIAPFCSISGAASKVQSGDKVYVKPGTYQEAVHINISGVQGAPIQFIAMAEEGDPVVVTSGTYGFDLSGEEEIVIQGFTIADTTSHGIRANLARKVTISGNYLLETQGRGISLSSADQVAVVDNYIEAALDYGIYMSGCSEIRVEGNYVTKVGQPLNSLTRKGIYVNGSANIDIEKNMLDSNTDAGIYLVNGSTSNYIKNNISVNNRRVYTRAAPGYEIKQSTNNTVEGNFAYDNEDSCINFIGSDGVDTNNLIVNNLCIMNGDHGIDVRDVPGTSIIGNTVYRNVTSGINVEGNVGSYNATIMNNISVDNAIDSPRKEGNINVNRNSVQGTVADFNLVYLLDPTEPTTTYKMYGWNEVEYVTLDELRSNVPGVEVHGLEADPLWVDASSFDYHLSSGSPAIDSANSEINGALPVDIDDNPRYDDPLTPNQGIGIRDYDDRGAYEFQVVEEPPPPPSEPITLYFRPVADVSVDAREPNENDGESSRLEVDGRPKQISYLRFEVNGLEGQVESARLRLKVRNRSHCSGGTIFISNPDWDEYTMTYNYGQPQVIGDAIDTLGPVNTGQLVEFDVTSAITGDAVYSFAIKSSCTDGADYYSREGSTETPVLIVDLIP